MNDQHHTPEEKPRKLPEWVNFNLIGAALLVISLGWSLFNIYSIEQELDNPNEIRVNVAHWQLELGYRDALNDVIEKYQLAVNGPYGGDYAKYNDHPDQIPHETLAKADFLAQAEYAGPFKFGKTVRIVQMPVTEKVYSQWLNTRLASKEAAAICEMGMATMTKSHKLVSRFFQPLTEHALESNPWNEGTPMEGVPWKDSFTDGMQGGYKPELQEYMSVPTTIYPLRIYFNVELVNQGKALLKEGIEADLAGKADELPKERQAPEWIVKKYQNDPEYYSEWFTSDEGPRSFGEMIAICDQLATIEHSSGRNIVPIAGSGYGATDWFVNKYRTSFMAHMEWDKKIDLNLDGRIDDIEAFTAMKMGKFTMDLPEVRAYWETMAELTRTFGKGYLARDRQSAVFAFIQGRAAMMPTGAWEAENLFQQAAKKFTVGVINFPSLKEGEPNAEYFVGPVNEATDNGSGLYGIHKFSPDINREVGIDFLKYWTSVEGNETFVQRAGLIAIVEKAKTPERMELFKPELVGYNSASAVAFNAWGTLAGELKSEQDKYLAGQTKTYEAFVEDWLSVLQANAIGDEQWRPAIKMWIRNNQGHVRDVKDRETVLSTIIMDEMSSARLVRQLQKKLETDDLNEEARIELQAELSKAQAAVEDARARYRQTMLDQVKMNNGQHRLREFERVTGQKAQIDDRDAFGRTGE